MAQTPTSTGVVISGSVYGGGNEGTVQNYSEVNIEAGTIINDVYGGGNQADVKKNTQVNMTNGTVNGNIYGGGNLGDVGTMTPMAGKPIGNYTWTGTDGNDNSTANLYATTNTGVTHVNITGGTPNQNVFGGGKGWEKSFWCEKGMVYSTEVKISNVTVGGSVYGGGELGRVETDTKVTIGAETGTDATRIMHDVFGAGQGVETHGYSALVRGNTEVRVQNGAKVDRNVYGGGEIASVGKYNVDAAGMPYSLANTGSGKCKVNIPGATQITGDIFGGGKGVIPNYISSGNNRSKRMVNYTSAEAHPDGEKGTTWDYADDHNYVWEYFADNDAYLIYLQTLALATETDVEINQNTSDEIVQSTKGSVYGGSENGIVQHDTKVTISGKCQIGEPDGSGNADVNSSGNIFGGGKGIAGNAGAGQVSGDATVIINSGTLLGSVYGGGVLGATRGNVKVNINGGTVNNNVYGGGALADTNTENWTEYVEVTGLTVDETSVTDYYEQSFGGIFTKTKDTKAVANKKYYQKTTATWADSDKKSANYITSVNLYGGLIKGDAYGGGLGRLESGTSGQQGYVSAIEPKVYGDVTVSLGKESEKEQDNKFSTEFEQRTTSGTVGSTTYTDIPNSARIFGCNNLNGSPKGAVTVNIYRTTVLNADGTIKDKPTKTTMGTATDAAPGTYELAAVYGGGNLATFDPIDPETPAKVNIYGCGLTSIKQVYGGGNAAPVPCSEVLVEGTYEIYQVFGGGNGKDPYTLDGTTWVANPGADVGIKSYSGSTPQYYGTPDTNPKDVANTKIGVAKVSIFGGTIHYAFGGSNTKGDVAKNSNMVLGNENIQGCEYNVGKAYGGANDAHMSGDIVIELGCIEGLDAIYGGARNADVDGNIILNITGGHFNKVFGGNDNGGALNGSITVNIEERSCLPVEIEELYGGGENAPYSVYGYAKDGSGNIIKDSDSRPTVLTAGDNPKADPQVNIISATRIGTIYGGGYGATATMVGNPHVNINMMKGTIDGHYTYQSGKSDTRYNESSGTYSYKDAEGNKLVLTSTEQTASDYPKALQLGSVGTVFGGGNAAEVKGNTFVNIGTGRANDGTTILYEDAQAATPVVRNAAPITGSVYGGGNQADVTGSTKVLICAIEGTGDTYTSVTENTDNVTIAENVFGAGKGVNTDATKALVGTDTKIVMGGGSVKKSVYGGGELSQVGGDTDIRVMAGTIGTPMVPATETTPEIRYGGEEYGNIYGGGKGNVDNNDGNGGTIADETLIAAGLIKGKTSIKVSGGTVLHNIYGGGAHGSVGTFTYDTDNTNSIVDGMPISCADNTGTATINITGGTIGYDGHNNGMIFGSSRGNIDKPNTIYDKVAWVYDTHVNIGDATSAPRIWGSVYGSGENGHTYHDAEVTISSGTIGDPGNYFENRGNVYGGGCGTDRYYSDPSKITGTHTEHDGEGDKYNHLAGIVNGNATVTINGGSIANNVYGAGSMGKVGGDTEVTINTDGSVGVDGAHDDGNVYGAARGELNLPNDYDYSSVTNTKVNIKNGTIKGNVFGGGKAGKVKGSVAVNVTGGQVIKDVYGGGALADTNTDNWDANVTPKPDLYVAKTGLTIHTETITGSDVSTYYTRNNDGTYTQASGEAQANTIYYEKTTDADGGWVSTAPNSGEYYTTKVEISGGTVGNVYGGGLGRLANGDDDTAEGYIAPIKAMVYGDVTVTINGSSATGATNDAKFTQNFESRTFNRTITNADNTTTQQSVTEKYYTTGRVFGCNNLNGTPKGNVNVTVWKTTPLGGGSHLDGKYEIQEVYGGGNLSAYTPAEGKKTEVHIHGCDDTSIFYVFGGGNAATVPETDVNIHGCREIETVFGGGNGNEPVKDYSGNWVESNGADVPGVAKLSLMGGLIHSAFAGSFVKGTCGVTVLDDKATGGDGCTLKVTNMYGGGKDAPVVSGININISGCSNANINSDIENIYAGSYNARISTGVTMNITGGIFKRVFGGNHQGGFINGPIDINVEETDNCKPIIIENLYGGGNLAPYPGPGTNTTNAKITINIKSCTHIGNVFGGGYGMNAVVTGNTELNINMMKGNWAGAAAPLGHSSLPNIHQANYAKVMSPVVGDIGSYYEKSGDTFTKTSDVALNDAKTYYVHYDSPIDVIDDAIGTIGNVYGGGDLGTIDGNTTINIGNATVVGIMKRNANGVIVNGSEVPVYDDKGMLVNGPVVLVDSPVLGANITGDVYGGGNEADVTGYTYVNISALMTPVLDNEDKPTGEYTYSKVDHSNTANFEGLSIGASVYGGGNKADVLKNTHVQMEDGYVFNGIFGGGYSGSVGTYPDNKRDKAFADFGHTPNHAGCIGKPTECQPGTGKCTVVVNGGQIGPVTVATVGMDPNHTHGGPVPQGWVWGGCCGAIEDPKTHPDTHFTAYVNETDVTIGGTAFVLEGVIGGGEFGRVLGNTHVTIDENCQIGVGYNYLDDDGKPKRYDSSLWTEAETAVTSGNASDINTVAEKMPECSHFDYGENIGTEQNPEWVYKIYDPYFEKYYGTKPADEIPAEFSNASTTSPSDGKTWIGVVFAGGSGYMPYEKDDGSGYDWCRSAGWVEGDTKLEIKGGHILTNAYGGNEYTDVKGKCTVKMTGGTIGVPRTLEQIKNHPVTCYLFGAGRGDERTHFNTITNVGSAEVEVSGGIIYGSVFGGGEDGHILTDAKVTIKDIIDTTNPASPVVTSSPKIGTWGTSYVDGNVFGGGRGFSGIAQTAGTVGGNVEVNITGGTMLGSIYGGGRLASVGTYFTNPENNLYGQLQEDSGGNTYGHIAVNISGGTIGGGKAGSASDLAAGYYDMKYSGNVFGGCMGRLTVLDGSINKLWPELAQAKTSIVNITGDDTEIKGNVYGGGEFGTVRENAWVTIGGSRTTVGNYAEEGTITGDDTAPTIDGSIFGGGLGSDNHTAATPITVHWAGGDNTYVYTPMQWAGSVGGNTYVNVMGGTVKKNVYGGGQLASVGIIDYSAEEVTTGGDITGIDNKQYHWPNIQKHARQNDAETTLYDFGLSWPYEFKYVSCIPDVNNPRIGGKATVNITGGTVGTNYSVEGNGYIFGGGQGQVDFGDALDDIAKQRYTEAFCANVRETAVTISGSAVRTVYGGGEDGHVYEDAKVTINSGNIANSVFGGGKGTSTYKTTLWTPGANNSHGTLANQDAHSWTAGKVYGNTEVIMNGGTVKWFIYGGGNLASVGKGNYSGGHDDYSTGGYGELPSASGDLWTTSYQPNQNEANYNPNKDLPWHFLNSGTATVTIMGGTVGTDGEGSDFDLTSLLPYGSVFGGSRGQVAKSANASPRYRYMPDFFLGYVNKAVINIGGYIANNATTPTLASTGPIIYGSVYGGGQDGHVRNGTEVKIYKGDVHGHTTDELGRSGHVFGAGSGIGTYTDGGKTYLNNSSGSVTCTTLVEVYGEGSGNEATTKIKGNIYGGGALASVGPYRPTGASSELHAPTDEHKSCSYTKVDIKGGAIGGSVFGASRGPSEAFLKSQFTDQSVAYDQDKFATDIWSDVNITGGVIKGNVYGGGEGGRVTESISVILTGGVIGTASAGGDVYGSGKGTEHLAANVGNNTSVELNPGKSDSDVGCVVRRIFGCNDLNGTPKGHASVHVYATQHRNTTDNPKIGTKYAKYGDVMEYTPNNYETYTYDGKTLEGLATDVHMSSTDITAYKGAITAAADADKPAKIEEWREAISELKYDVLAVYGGGNLAPYMPTKLSELTSVVIDGCALTSIKQVYGGGNAACVPAASLRVNEAYEIDEAFGGGNGKDSYLDPRDNKWYQNPGANVGYEDFTERVGGESGADEEHAISQTDKSDANTSANRKANYGYGSGVATTNILGGRIHKVYGGSNKRGNISNTLLSVYQESGMCELVTDYTYGAGKDAPTDASPVVKMDCVNEMSRIFGGSTNADVYNDITLTITNGTYGQVFGGNDTNGAIYGSITVIIEEGGCKPINITELYAGGFEAPYSKYGYKTKDDGTYDRDDNGKLIPLTSGDNPKNDPCINVISASSIGTIYGGGYKAAVVGTPHVNVNMKAGKVEVVNKGTDPDPVWMDNQGKPWSETKPANIYPADKVTDETTYYYSDNGLRVEVQKLELTTELQAALTTQVGVDDSAYKETDGGKTYVYQDITGKFYTVAEKQTRVRNWAALDLGSVGSIYGGGNEAEIIGDTHVEIGTGTHHDMSHPETAPTAWEPARNSAKITGSVFGGGYGANAYIQGNTYINMGAGATVDNNIYGGGELGSVGPFSTTDNIEYTFPSGKGVCNIEITGGRVGPETMTPDKGNVFGGGKGHDAASAPYLCEEAMAYSTNVNITNGTVTGNVYGGGEVARLENNTVVTIGEAGSGTSAPVIKGNLYGGGKGLRTHGYSALARGDANVTIQGKARVEGSVYGGGEMASMGRYVVSQETSLPTAPKSGGKCTIEIKDYAEIGHDGMKMYHGGVEGEKPDDWGHVFGGGRGTLPYDGYSASEKPWSILANGSEQYYTSSDGTATAASETAYFNFLKTLALASETDITIGGHAFVKGSVYGGSENGRVQADTHVKIQEYCQIGNGMVQMYDNGVNDGEYLSATIPMNRRYTEAEWAAGHLFVTGDPDFPTPLSETESTLRSAVGDNYQHSLPECSSWKYGTNSNGDPNVFAPYDKFANTTGNLDEYPTIPEGATDKSTHGGRREASDGHSFYGSVCGGGSGYYPYKPGKWHPEAGYVGGNTYVNINGGHILTNAYGGNEMSNVAGTCYVTMTGGTVGVPRTLGQIDKHPVTCYIFGGGMGESRDFFNSTQPVGTPGSEGYKPGSYGSINVGNTVVEVSGGWVYGSVFGGAEDGHVLGDTKVTIKGTAVDKDKTKEEVYADVFAGNATKIGTWGTSYVDGNIFGGGRGFSGSNIQSGNVVGNATVNIEGGTILGSIYGGGRLASVGTDFSKTETPQNGFFQDDVAPVYYTQEEIDAASEGDPAWGKTTSDVKTSGVTTGLVTINVSGGVIGNDLEYTAPRKGSTGNNLHGLSEDIDNWTPEIWEQWKAYNNIPKTVFDKETRLAKVTKGGKVFGGSMGRLTKLDGTINPNWPKVGQVKNTIVNISGGTIKRDVLGGGEFGTVKENTHVNISGGTINFDVYGGGYGSEDNTHHTVLTVGEGSSAMYFVYTPMMFAGCVGGNTYVDISGGWIKKNVFGGGEVASVGIIDYSAKNVATDSNGEVTSFEYINNHEHRDITGEGTTNEKVYGFGLSWPWEVVYTDLIADGGKTYINVTGGRLGLTGKDFMGPFDADGKPWDVKTGAVLDENVEAEAKIIKAARQDNGDIYGGSQGMAGDRYDMAFCANVKETHVTINYPSSEDEAKPDNYKKKASGDKISNYTYTKDCIAGSVYGGGDNGHVLENTEVTLKHGLIGHAIYGGGSGKGKYSTTIKRLDNGNDWPTKIYSLTAGKVYGNTKVTMEGGYVVRNIYGGGNMASIGKGNYAGGTDDYYPAGYGETLVYPDDYEGAPANKKLWSSESEGDYAWHFLNSGETKVIVTGGQVGYVKSSDPSDTMKDGLPYGNVYGGCRGEAAPNILDSPRYKYCPGFFSGYANVTNVTIGTEGSTDGPTIYGSVYGGGQDGHVRRDATVTVYGGEIGLPFNETNRDIFNPDTDPDPEVVKKKSLEEELDDPQWLYRGNVYGSGSGISKYEYDLNYNKQTFTDTDGNGELDEGETIDEVDYTNPSSGKTSKMKEIDYSTSAGSVTRFTEVNIFGGIIHRNVYGGGSLASVGPPAIPPTRPDAALIKHTPTTEELTANKGVGWQSMCTVNIVGTTIGTPDGYVISPAVMEGGVETTPAVTADYNSAYGGEVYGGSRGLIEYDENNKNKFADFATTVWTQVNIKNGTKATTIMGNVFGGGDAGKVKKDTDVRIGDE